MKNSSLCCRSIFKKAVTQVL
ncbi:unnamed protein product [Larinioides sclopetarius]|uniref:Uncharacterized protein n=1 Tax=Larinioides sclopetarius TaxID=280406 RepID=A0AAV1ZEE1_9ARAC